MAQTAVEFLEKQLTLALGDELKDLRGLFVVAKEMDRKEKIEVYKHGQNNGYNYRSNGRGYITGEEYYEQTFTTQAHDKQQS